MGGLIPLAPGLINAVAELTTNALERPMKTLRVMRRREFCERRQALKQSETSRPAAVDVSPQPVEDAPLPGSSMSVRGSMSVPTAKRGRGYFLLVWLWQNRLSEASCLGRPRLS